MERALHSAQMDVELLSFIFRVGYGFGFVIESIVEAQPAFSPTKCIDVNRIAAKYMCLDTHNI